MSTLFNSNSSTGQQNLYFGSNYLSIYWNNTGVSKFAAPGTLPNPNGPPTGYVRFEIYPNVMGPPAPNAPSPTCSAVWYQIVKIIPPPNLADADPEYYDGISVAETLEHGWQNPFLQWVGDNPAGDANQPYGGSNVGGQMEDSPSLPRTASLPIDPLDPSSGLVNMPIYGDKNVWITKEFVSWAEEKGQALPFKIYWSLTMNPNFPTSTKVSMKVVSTP